MNSKKTLEMIKDAQDYLNKIEKHLKEMGELSTSIGMNTHAIVWYTLITAWSKGPEEFITIVDMMRMYLKYTSPISHTGKKNND